MLMPRMMLETTCEYGNTSVSVGFLNDCKEQSYTCTSKPLCQIGMPHWAWHEQEIHFDFVKPLSFGTSLWNQLELLQVI